MYIVVIGSYFGPPIWLTFESKKDFDTQYRQSWGRIIDEGVTRDEAVNRYHATRGTVEDLKPPTNSE
jgi:hypothetical protein